MTLATMQVDPVELFAYKTLSTSVFNTDVLQSDPELFVDLPPLSTWIFEARLIARANSLAMSDIQIFFAMPSTPSFHSWSFHPEWSASEGFLSSRHYATDPAAVIGLPAAADRVVLVKGIVRTSVNGGPLRLMWAQGTAKTDQTYVKLGSYLLAERVA